MVALPAKFLNSISFGMTEENEHRVKRLKFGDGWSARVADGINSLETEFKMSWNDLSIEDALEIKDFWLDREGTQSVQFTPPDHTAELSVLNVGKGVIRYVAYNLRSFSITVERVYDNA